MQRIVLLCAAAVCAAGGNLADPNAAGVSWAHFHFNARDLAAARTFWTTLGATPDKALANNDVYKVENAYVLVRKGEPSSGTEATLVHHVGFRVRDLDGTLQRIRQAGFKVLTPAETTAKTHKANVMGPDEINIELVGDSQMNAVIASHHVHFYNNPIEGTRDWYVKTFGAKPGKRDVFEAADVPGINLSFSSPKGPVTGTKGAALDHIGFEVKDLEAFCRKLEAAGIKFDRPFTKVPAIGLSIAFFTDPWGTYIELTEGLGLRQ